MANEHTIFIRTHHPVPFTVSNTVGIEKGAVLRMLDPLTASGASLNNEVVAGIAASEKIASDGKTKLGVFRGGVFKATASGTVTVGDALVTSASLNYLQTAPQAETVSGVNIIGIALETATATQTFLYELNPQVIKQ